MPRNYFWVYSAENLGLQTGFCCCFVVIEALEFEKKQKKKKKSSFLPATYLSFVCKPTLALFFTHDLFFVGLEALAGLAGIEYELLHENYEMLLA